MPSAFDEMLGLEEQAQQHGIALANCRDTVRNQARKIAEARTDIKQIERTLETLNLMVKNIKTEASVVLLSEYEQILHLIEDNTEILDSKRRDIVSAERKIKDAREQIPFLEATLAGIEQQLSGYGQVLQFKR